MKTIGSLRIAEKTLTNMEEAITQYNKQNVFSVSQSDFRRMALELLSQLILQNIPILLKIK